MVFITASTELKLAAEADTVVNFVEAYSDMAAICVTPLSTILSSKARRFGDETDDDVLDCVAQTRHAQEVTKALEASLMTEQFELLEPTIK